MIKGFKVIDSVGRIKTSTDPPNFVIGTNVEAWDADLDALAAQTGSGVVCRTAANTYAQRTITGGVGITVTDGGGITGAPTIALDASAAVLVTGPIAISDAQWKSLSTSPVTIMTGTESGSVIVPLKLTMYRNPTAAYSAGSTVNIRWSGVANDLTVGIAVTNDTTPRFNAVEATGTLVNITGSTITGAALVLRANADVTSGTGTNICKIWVTYFVAKTS